MSGWFKHPRDLRGSFDPNPLKDAKLLAVYIYLAENANWKDTDEMNAGHLRISIPKVAKDVALFGLEETRALVDRLCKLGLISLLRITTDTRAGYIFTIMDYQIKFGSISTHDLNNPWSTHGEPMVSIPKQLENVDDSPCKTHGEPMVNTEEVKKKRKKAVAVCKSPDDDMSYLTLATEWNNRLPTCRQVDLTLLMDNEKLKRDIRKSIKKYTLEFLLTAIDRISTSTFLCSKKEGKWKTNFTWFLKTENLQKIMEGNYDTVFGKESKEEYKGPFDVRDIVLCKQPTKLN